MVTKNNRFKITLSSFDFIKGFCMLATILGHMAYRYSIEELALPLQMAYFFAPISAGLMPLFFIVSGYGFKEKPAAKMLKLTFSQLMKPYLLVMLIFIAVYPLTFRLWYGEWAYGIGEAKRYLIAFLLGIPKPGKVLFGDTVHHCSAVWFFLASFIAANLLNLILKIKNKAVQAVLVGVSIVVGYWMVICDINFYCIPQGLMVVGYFYLGYLMKKYNLFERAIKSPWTYVALVPVSILFCVFGDCNLCLGSFNNGLLDYFGSSCVALLLMFAGVYIGSKSWKIVEWLGGVGIYTYWIICIHTIENDCMQWFAYMEAIPNINLAFVGELILKAVIIVSGCFILKRIMQYRYRRRRMQNGKL